MLLEVIIVGILKNEFEDITKNNKGTPMKIIAYRGQADIDVEFLDDFHYVKRNTTYTNFIRGQIKNPYDKTIANVGYLGVGEYIGSKNHIHTTEYSIWEEMLIRCYSNTEKHKHSSYYNISTVYEDWHNFQSFARWYDNNKYECEGRLHLDKDILIPGNKIYSPETCLLVPQRINMLFLNKQNKRGLPNGITKSKSGYVARYNGNIIGFYKSLKLAFYAYAAEKEKTIKEVAEEYMHIIPEKLYNAMNEYKVLIENDKNYIPIKE